MKLISISNKFRLDKITLFNNDSSKNKKYLKSLI